MKKESYKRRMRKFRVFLNFLEEWELSEVDYFDDQEIVEIFKNLHGWNKPVDLLSERAVGCKAATPQGRQEGYGCRWVIHPMQEKGDPRRDLQRRRERDFFVRVEIRDALRRLRDGDLKGAKERLELVLSFYGH